MSMYMSSLRPTEEMVRMVLLGCLVQTVQKQKNKVECITLQLRQARVKQDRLGKLLKYFILFLLLSSVTPPPPPPEPELD